MKREDLAKLGLTDDAVIDAIMAAHGKDIEKHKADIEALKTAKSGLEAQITEASATIEGFKALKPEELKVAADEWKAKAEQAAKDAAAQVENLRFDYALRDALKEHKAKDPADVIPHLRRDALKLGDDGKFIGLAEQISPLKTAKDYLFESTTPAPKFVTGANSQPVTIDAVAAAARTAAGLPAK